MLKHWTFDRGIFDGISANKPILFYAITEELCDRYLYKYGC